MISSGKPAPPYREMHLIAVNLLSDRKCELCGSGLRLRTERDMYPEGETTNRVKEKTSYSCPLGCFHEVKTSNFLKPIKRTFVNG